MFKFEYEIRLNDNGRPYIEPAGDTIKELFFDEHKFLGVELCRTFVTQTIRAHQLNPVKKPLHPEQLERLIYLEREIGDLSDMMAGIVREQFDLLDIADRLIHKTFDVSVGTIQERDDLNYNGFIFDDRLFKRVEGLKVKVLQLGRIYELKNGVDNEHWVEI